MRVPGRREQTLAAAVEVLAAGGSRALTHRAVDDAAGLPRGTTSNHFRTRTALVAGVLSHISAQESGPVGELPDLDVDGLVALVAERIGFLLGPGRSLTLARHPIFLEASRDPVLRADLLAESAKWWRLGERLLAALDCPRPAERSRWLFAYIDGLLADQLARPAPAFDPAAAVRTALEGLLR